MPHEKYRYFIELKSDLDENCARQEAQERRRLFAMETIARLKDWIASRGFDEKVGTVQPTAFGQVQITCGAEVMRSLREEEALPIAAVRQGSLISWVAAR